MIFFALCSIVFFEYYLFYIKMVVVFIYMCDISCLIFILIDISILSYNLFCVFRFLPIFAFKFMIIVSNMKA